MRIIMVSVAFKNRTRDEIIAAFRESIRKKEEWQQRVRTEFAELRAADERPAMRVVELQHRTMLLQTSGTRQSYGTAVEEEWE